MTLEKSYLGTIVSGFLTIVFFITLFSIQNYYVQKFNTLANSIPPQKDSSSFNEYLFKVNKYYQTQIKELNKKNDLRFKNFKNLYNDSKNKIDIINLKYKQLDMQNKKSIHKFVINMLRYNPYLLESQMIDEITNYFNTSLVPLK